jgi:hypothetical protein
MASVLSVLHQHASRGHLSHPDSNYHNLPRFLHRRCLDGAQRLLKPDGISIPASYTSFLAPVTTSKLWDAVRNYKDLEHCETPYVVKFHRWG